MPETELQIHHYDRSHHRRSDAARAKVLCVDDDRRTVEGLARALWPRFDVVTAQHPLAAMSLLEAHGDFAVVLTDVKMPGIDGFTFLKKVQDLSPTTTRLVLTGLVEVDSRTIVPGTAFRLVQKPCPAEILIEIVADAVNYHALLAASPIQPVEARIVTPLLPPAVEVGEVPRPGSTEDSPKAPWQIVDAPLKPLGAPARARASMALQDRIGLRMSERTIELLQGSTVVGRSRTCHIPINDPRVSRQHVCFLNDGRELTVRNLARTNAVLVNGSAIDGAGPHHLEIGDRITIGSRELQVTLLGDYCPSLEPTQQSLAQDARRATLVDVADAMAKFVRLGQWQHVERIVRPQLDGLLRYCSAGQKPSPADLDAGVLLALDLGEFNRAGEWITYLFDLLATQGTPASADVLERLYRIVSNTPQISMTSYRRYLEALAKNQAQFGATQRFLVRRLRGLEHLLMISAHN